MPQLIGGLFWGGGVDTVVPHDEASLNKEKFITVPVIRNVSVALIVSVGQVSYGYL